MAGIGSLFPSRAAGNYTTVESAASAKQEGTDVARKVLRRRLSREQKARLARLLDMMYTPVSLAKEVGLNVRQVYRVYIPLGCPHERDENNRIWIHGTSFREWATAIYEKRKLAKDEAFCLTCRQAVLVTEPVLRQKEELTYLECDCPRCGRRLARIVTSQRQKS